MSTIFEPFAYSGDLIILLISTIFALSSYTLIKKLPSFINGGSFFIKAHIRNKWIYVVYIIYLSLLCIFHSKGIAATQEEGE